MNSPGKSADQVLGVFSVKESKNFLMDCLNLPNSVTYPDHRPHFERWLKRWHRIFTFRKEDEDGKWQAHSVPREQLEKFMPKLWETLRRIWYEKDSRQRDWYFYRLRDEYNRLIARAEYPYLFLDLTASNAVERLQELQKISRTRGDDASQRARFFETWATAISTLDEAPRICPFEAAVYWLQVNQKEMLYCGGPVCAAPYIFRTEKGQKYCSPECADPARREAKLRWWNENRKSEKRR